MSDLNADGNPHDFVIVHECLGLADAEEIARVLEAEEISVFLNNESMAALFPGAMGGISAGGLGRVKILVSDAQADRAREIVGEAIIERDRRDGAD